MSETADYQAILDAYAGDDLALRQMIEGAHQVGEMLKHPGWAHYRDYLYSEIAHMQARIQSGTLPDYAEYKFWAGKVQGIDQALGAYARLTETVRAALAERAEAQSEPED